MRTEKLPRLLRFLTSGQIVEGNQEIVSLLNTCASSGGVAILDGHQTSIDIMETGSNLLNLTYVDRLVVPVAHRHYYHPIEGYLFNRIGRLPYVQLYPVVRNEDSQRNPGLMEQRSTYNLPYFQALQKARTSPHTAVLVAPMGTRGGRRLKQDLHNNLYELEFPCFITLTSRGCTKIEPFSFTGDYHKDNAELLRQFDSMRNLSVGRRPLL